jgi:putative CocE/NonD family hydrolase
VAGGDRLAHTNFTSQAVIPANSPPLGPISERRFDDLETLHGLEVPARDGTRLSLDVVKPKDLAEPLPVVLIRTPYDKTIVRESKGSIFESLAERGYACAFNDCRGRFNSGGEFHPYMGEARDGYDVVEWVAQQEWCDGQVGMTGASYAGQTCWYAASAAPPHLEAIAPFVSPPASLWRNEPFLNGIFRTCMAEWMVSLGLRSWQDSAWHEAPFSAQQSYYDAVPFAQVGRFANSQREWWDSWMMHSTFDGYWRGGSYDNYDEIAVPALNITGWWDMNFPGAPENFEEMGKRGATSRSRAGGKLVIGGWSHMTNQTRVIGGEDLGPDCLIPLFDYVVRFFDRWLKGQENGIEREKPVHIFVLGSNKWRAEDDWPLPGTEEVSFYFHSDGSANSLLGDGRLSLEKPAAAEPADHYTYDPMAAERTLWELDGGPVDDRIATARNDILCYTTEALTESLEVVGWVNLQLYAASSATDTDWHARLVDVRPDGTTRFLCHGAMRARFRNSLDEPELLVPGEPTLFEFNLDATGICFLPGHRIRIEICSSWFTQWSRNMNNGSENPQLEATPQVAEQTVFHEPNLASRVILPRVPPPSCDSDTASAPRRTS